MLNHLTYLSRFASVINQANRIDLFTLNRLRCHLVCVFVMCLDKNVPGTLFLFSSISSDCVLLLIFYTIWVINLYSGEVFPGVFVCYSHLFKLFFFNFFAFTKVIVNPLGNYDVPVGILPTHFNTCCKWTIDDVSCTCYYYNIFLLPIFLSFKMIHLKRFFL